MLKRLRSTVLYPNLCETKKITVSLISNSDAILIVIRNGGKSALLPCSGILEVRI